MNHDFIGVKAMQYIYPITKLIRGVSLALTIVCVSFVLEQPVFVANTEPKPSQSPGRPIIIRTGTGRGVGGSRGQCSQASIPFTALVPPTVAITTSERPTFWFYSPYTGSALKADFTVQNDDEQSTAKPISFRVTLPEKPGFVRMRLRSVDPSLNVSQSYHWFFKVFCNDPNGTKVTVEGSLQVASKLSPIQLPSDELDGRAFDAIAALAELRLKKPQDAALLEEWKQLLRSLKFELETHPLTPEEVNEIAVSPLNP